MSNIKVFIVAISCLSIFGCGGAQLNSNALEIASKFDSLLTEQVLLNISNFIDSEAAVPAQGVISQSTISTTNTISPSVTEPFTHAVSTTTGLVQAAASTITNTNQRSIGSGSATLSASNVSGQNYIVSPVTDGDDLARLSSLYRFAIDGNLLILFESYQLKTVSTPDGAEKYDFRFLREPGCVLCRKEGAEAGAWGVKQLEDLKETLCINKNLISDKTPRCYPDFIRQKFDTPLIKYRNIVTGKTSEQAPTELDNFLGRKGFNDLYVSKKDASRFARFTLLIAGAVSRPAGSSSASSRGTSGALGFVNPSTGESFTAY